MESVSAELGNTPAVCRRCYIHPEVLDAHLDGTLGDVLGQKTARTGLTSHEAAVLALPQVDRLVSCSDRIRSARSNRVERARARVSGS